MPSSIAILASGGGASDAAVANTSATNISDRPAPRYGRSSTSRPRSLRPRPPVCRQRRRISSREIATRSAVPRHQNPATSRSTGLRGEEDLVGQALLDDLAVQVGDLEQLVVRAARDELAVLEHDDLVGQRDRRQAVGDDERRPAGHHLAQRDLDLLLGRRVDRRRRVVEDEDPRVGEQRAGDRDPLALAAATASGRARRRACRSRRAARSMKSCACARRAAVDDLLARRVLARVGDVLVHASR